MRLSIIKLFLLATTITVLSSCGTGKKATEELERLPKVKEELLIQRLDSLSKQRPDHFFARINSKYSDNNTNVSFKTTITMAADSALQANITFANIPIYNAVITTDTLTLLDRRNKCYIKEGVAYLKQQFNVDFSHKNIEELFLGLPIAWDEKQEYQQLKDPYNYVISQTNEKDIKSLEAGKDGIIIRYFLTEDTKNIKRVIIDSPKDTTSITVNYAQYEQVEDFIIPKMVEVKIKTARNEIFADFKYAKVEINAPRTLYLTIPEKYEHCE